MVLTPTVSTPPQTMREVIGSKTTGRTYGRSRPPPTTVVRRDRLDHLGDELLHVVVRERVDADHTDACWQDEAAADSASLLESVQLDSPHVPSKSAGSSAGGPTS